MNSFSDLQIPIESVILQENSEDLEYNWSNIPQSDTNWTINHWTTSYEALQFENCP